jgi:hypothetical protein
VLAINETLKGRSGAQWLRRGPVASRLLKNYLRCHRCVKNSLVRESDQNAHLQHVNSAFSPVFALRWLSRLRFSTAC